MIAIPQEQLWDPNFLGIGVPRAGTTWLWENLRRHPEVWMPGTKELHWYDYHSKREIRFLRPIPISDRAKRNLRYGIRFLPGNLLGRVTGEITPAYSMLPAPRVRDVVSDVEDLHVILLLRDPVERAWSHVKRDFENHYRTPLSEASEEKIIEFLDTSYLREAGDYGRILSNWFNCLDDDRIHVEFTEGIKEEPETMIRRVLRFLGADDSRSPPSNQLRKDQNTTEEHPLPKAVRRRLEERYSGIGKTVERWIGRQPPWEV